MLWIHKNNGFWGKGPEVNKNVFWGQGPEVNNLGFGAKQILQTYAIVRSSIPVRITGCHLRNTTSLISKAHSVEIVLLCPIK